MTETGATGPSEPWVNRKPLLIAWLLVFFPVGLYALWKGALFDRTWKIGITALVAVAFLVAGINFTHPLYVFCLVPVAIVVLWRDSGTARKTVYGFTACWPLILALFLYEKGSSVAGGGSYNDGGSCSAVMTEGNCTYFRDSDCTVIARECS